jgi:hypothetical protein
VGKTIADLKQVIDGIGQSVEAALESLEGLDGATTIFDPNIGVHIPQPPRMMRGCVEPLKIPDLPTFVRHCMAPVDTLDGSVTVQDLREILKNMEDWMGDVREVIDNLDQKTELPPAPPVNE